MHCLTSSALELRPDSSLARAAQASWRSCVTYAASGGGGSAPRSKPSSRGGGGSYGDPRTERLARTHGGSQFVGGDPTPSRSAPRPVAPQRPPHGQRGPEAETSSNRDQPGRRNSDAGGPRYEPFQAPRFSSSSTPFGGGSRRSEQERAARKAARMVDKAAAVSRNSQGCCYGCGAALQTEVPLGAGYVAPAKYEVKKQRRQLDKVLCQRCGELCNGAMIPAVQDFTQKLQLRQLMGEAGPPGARGAAASDLAPADSGAGPEGPEGGAAVADGPAAADEADKSLLGKVLISPEELRAQLKPLALRAAVVVLLVDLTDASGSLMARVRDMVGRNPIVMVGTKLDLLPLDCRPRDVADWLAGAAAAKRLNVVSVHLVSSHTGDGMSPAVSRICRERKSRDVYVVGAANVGKSAFVRAMLKEMARTDPAAISTGKYLPVESPMPGTTLGLISLRAFSEGGILFDTPGVHLHHRVPHMLSPPELKLLHPRRRLAAVVPPLPLELTETAGSGADAVADPRVDGGAGGASSIGDPDSGGEGTVRRGRGGLKIVDHLPTDEYGMPITGLDAGVRRAGGRGEAGGRPAGRDGGLKIEQPQTVRATYMWSDLVRIDVLSGPPSTALVFYGPSTMRAVGLPYIRPDQNLEVDYGGGSGDGGSSSGGGGGRLLVCTESVAARGGLQPQELVVRANGAAGASSAPLADVAVSGLPGWVSVWAPKAKKDVRLRVWAPRGVEVMQRPALPVPPPRALERAWRGERGRAGDDDDDDDDDEEGEEPAALNEWSRALAAGGMGDPTSDPAWWEAMAALKDEDLPGYGAAAAGGRGGGSGKRGQVGSRRRAAAAGVSDDEDDDLPEWVDEEAEEVDEEESDGARRERERVVVTARVEDILKRPRLDVLTQMDLEFAGDGEDEEEEEDARDEEDDVAAFTLTKSAAGRRRRDGPAADGAWDPLAASAAAAPGSAAVPPAALPRRTASRKPAAEAVVPVRRRPAVSGRSSDVAAAEGEQEEEEAEAGVAGAAVWDEAGAGVMDSEEQEDAVAGSVRRRGVARTSRRRLGRRREVVQQVVPEAGAEGDVEQVQGEVA